MGLLVVAVASVVVVAGGVGFLAWHERRPAPWDPFETAMIELGVPPVRTRKRRRNVMRDVPRPCRGTFAGLPAGFDEGESVSPRIEIWTSIPSATEGGPIAEYDTELGRPAPVFWVEAKLQAPPLFVTHAANGSALRGQGPHRICGGGLPPGLVPLSGPDRMLTFGTESAPPLSWTEQLRSAFRRLPADAAAYVDAPRVVVIVLRGQRTHPMSSRLSRGPMDFERSPRRYLEAAAAIAEALAPRGYR